MPATCVNCGEQDFDLIDGRFYCTQCQTQTQDLLEEQEDDYLHDFMPASLEIRARPSKEPSQTAEVYQGRPWRIHEGFGIILREQVQALVRLGANPLLEDVAWRIWVLYLSKLKLAFCEEETESDENKQNGAKADLTRHRARDKFMGTVTDPQPKTRMRPSAAHKKAFGVLPRGKNRRRLEIQQEQFAASMQTHDFYEGDNPLEEDEEQNALERDLLKLAEAEKESLSGEADEDQDQAKPTIFRTVYCLNKVWVLCVAYLGLQYTNNLVMPADMMRLVESGQVPYTQAEFLFPEDMKLGALDQNVFLDRRCDADILRRRTGILAKFLDLKDFPAPALEVLASRYITELNLPSEMHGLVHELVKLLPAPDALSKLRNLLRHYSAMAMAYIVITLKLLFCLDDTTEAKLSTYARELEQATDCAQPLFIWEEWVVATDDKLSATKASGITTGADCGSQPTAGPACKVSSKFSQRVKKCSVRAETRDSLGKPFQVLLSKVMSQSNTSADDEPATDAPFRRTESEPTVQSPLSVGPRLSSPLQTKDFSHCTLRYLTEETDFVEEVLNNKRPALHSGFCSGDPAFMDEDPSAVSGSANPETKKLLWTLLDKCSEVSRDSDTENDMSVESTSVSFPRAYTKYLTYPFFSRKTIKLTRHSSYTWLLNICTQHIETTQNVLEYTVRQMEEILFPETAGREQHIKLKKYRREQLAKSKFYASH